MTGDYQQCVKEYGELIARYAADVVGHNQRALCSSQLRDMRERAEEMRQAVELLPNRAIFRLNLALYRELRGRFSRRGNSKHGAVQHRVPTAFLPSRFAQMGQGQLPQAMETYRAACEDRRAWDILRRIRSRRHWPHLKGVSRTPCEFLEQGAAADLASKNPDRAAAKFASLAYAQLSRGQRGQPSPAAERSVGEQHGREDPVPGGTNTSSRLAKSPSARPLIAGLASELQAEPQAYAKIAEGLSRAEGRRSAPGHQEC